MDFDKLYQTYYMQVYSYVMTLVKNAHLAEEITQEVFFKALKSHKTYAHKASELTWLCAIAKNSCIDELRKQPRFQELDDELPSDDNIQQAVEDENTTLQIHQILHHMEEPYKEVFQLRIFGELSFKNIGQIFGKTESWARVTYHRARIKIQERMNKYGA
ncbi:MAG: sigma-70 family RNA polymerase sigma factor [Bacillus sp. (in: Bacteria)]|nr:sigma-70 family RNA polymerase sigma factor [Bacillus sp. (in: firmicutes)]MCM1425558.1 sigma-70 family RNA polymerase sigma factor [Eubacterium sp.]